MDDFRWQIETVARLFNVVSGWDLLDWIAGKPLPRRPALVTFDDGYRNNLTLAADVLERCGVPAVFHLATGYIGTQQLLWPQELDERILTWPHKTVPAPDRHSEIPLPSDWQQRVSIAEQLRRQCKMLSDRQRQTYLDQLRRHPLPPRQDWQRELYDFMDWDDVGRLAQRGFAVGSHSVRHAILSQLGPEQLDVELRQSKAQIEQHLQQPCHWIAYPNGTAADVSPQVLAASRRAGYSIGLTLMDTGCVDRDRPLEIDRICVMGGEPRSVFQARMSGLYGRIRRVFRNEHEPACAS